jgi:ribosomal subunit interface protein
MNIVIYSKNLELAPAFKKQIEKKFSKITTFIDKIISFRVDLSHDAHHRKGKVYRIEVNLNIPGKMFRIVEYDFILESGVNKVKARLIRQLSEYKRKSIKDKRFVK